MSRAPLSRQALDNVRLQPIPTGKKLGRIVPVSISNADACFRSLLPHRRPPAIPRLVISVSSTRSIVWTRRRLGAHVIQEHHEALQPSIANLDPTAAVQVKMIVPRIEAPFLHLHHDRYSDDDEAAGSRGLTAAQ